MFLSNSIQFFHANFSDARQTWCAQASAAVREEVLVNFSFASKQFASTCFVVFLASNQ